MSSGTPPSSPTGPLATGIDSSTMNGATAEKNVISSVVWPACSMSPADLPGVGSPCLTTTMPVTLEPFHASATAERTVVAPLCSRKTPTLSFRPHNYLVLRKASCRPCSHPPRGRGQENHPHWFQNPPPGWLGTTAWNRPPGGLPRLSEGDFGWLLPTVGVERRGEEVLRSSSKVASSVSNDATTVISFAGNGNSTRTGTTSTARYHVHLCLDRPLS